MPTVLSTSRCLTWARTPPQPTLHTALIVQKHNPGSAALALETPWGSPYAGNEIQRSAWPPGLWAQEACSVSCIPHQPQLRILWWLTHSNHIPLLTLSSNQCPAPQPSRLTLLSICKVYHSVLPLPDHSSFCKYLLIYGPFWKVFPDHPPKPASSPTKPPNFTMHYPK